MFHMVAGAVLNVVAGLPGTGSDRPSTLNRRAARDGPRVPARRGEGLSIQSLDEGVRTVPLVCSVDFLSCSDASADCPIGPRSLLSSVRTHFRPAAFPGRRLTSAQRTIDRLAGRRSLGRTSASWALNPAPSFFPLLLPLQLRGRAAAGHARAADGGGRRARTKKPGRS